MVVSISYNVLLGIMTLAFIVVARRLHGLWPLILLGAYLFVACILAFVFGEDLFGVMRLLAYAAFVHVPIVLLAWCTWLRKDSLRAALIIGTAALGIAAIGVEAFVIAPKRLDISRIQLTNAKLKRSLRIVVVADLQYDNFGEHEKGALRKALDERPDLILMPGDYIQVSDPAERMRLVAGTNRFLKDVGFSAPLGTYAVGGNIDPTDWPNIFEGLPVTVFKTTRQVANKEFVITGLSYEMSGRANTHVPPDELFHIALGHSPNFALGDVQADLLVAGHTHGGQVRIPFYGPLLTFSAIPREWASGLTSLAGGRSLVVSRGIGMERGRAPRLRFLCNPELVVIDVEPA